MVRIVVISDTHNCHHEVVVPFGDIFIHAGDFTIHGQLDQIEDFNTWLGTLPHAVKVVVPGNHENVVLRKHPDFLKKTLSNATFLCSEGIEAFGLKIFGTKFIWAMEPDDPYYSTIPADTNILVTHSPPDGIFSDKFGCPYLLKRVQEVKPLLHVFGHVHSQFGMGKGSGALANTIFVNASVCGSKFTKAHDPVVLDI